jgi:hypothetical protein
VVQEDSYKIYLVIFLNIPTSFYEFWKFEQFLGIKTIEKTIKTDGLRIRPTACGARPDGLPRTPCALTVRSQLVARACASVVTRSTMMRWGLAGGKVLPVSTGGVPGVVLGKKSGGGAHRGCRATVQR